MSGISTWFVSGWIHLAVGFAFGWLVFKRPDLITRWFDKIKDRLGFG